MSHLPHLSFPSAAYDESALRREQPAGWTGAAVMWLGRLLTIAPLIVAPWLLGGVDYRVQTYLYSFVVAALGLSGLAHLAAARHDGTRNILLPAALIPLVCGLILAAVQLLPLGKLSPAFIANDVPFSTGRISLYPASTRLDLSQLTIATSAFAVGVLLFSQKSAQKWLWGAIAFNGAALAFLGIARKIDPQVASFAFSGLGGKSFATYINKNNAAGYLNLSFAACIGWAFFGREIFARVNPRQSESLGDRQRRGWWEAMVSGLSQIARLDGRMLFALGVAVVIVGGICCSLSRGGLVAVVFSILLLAASAIWQRGWVIGLGLLVLIVCFSLGLVGWVNLDREATERASTLIDGRATNDARIGNWRDATGAVRESWLTGTGLGTYRYAYLPHQDRFVETWFYHAENQYIEALVEGGIVGLGLLLAAILAVAAAIRSLLRSRHNQHLPIVGLVGLVVLAGQGLQAMFDFGLYLPANMLTMAVLTGAVCGTAAAAAQNTSQRVPAVAFTLYKPGAILLGIVLLVNGGLAVRDVSAAGTAERARSELPTFATADDVWSAREVDRALSRAEQAIRERPDDAELRVAVADLLIHRFRRESMLQLEQSEFGYYYDRQQQWELTAPLMLHRRANQFFTAGQTSSLMALRNDAVVQRNLLPALLHLRAAKSASPLLPRVDIQLAALSFLRESNPTGAKLWRRAAALTPSDPEILTQTGMLAMNAGQVDEACGYWRRCLKLTPRYEQPIMQLALETLDAEQIATELMPASPQYILNLVRTRFASENHAELRQRLLSRADRLMGEARQEMPTASWHYLHGELDRLQNRPRRAVTHFRRAVELSPNELEWRLELAKALHEHGSIEEAREQAGICALMSPGRKDIELLRRQLIEAEIRR